MRLRDRLSEFNVIEVYPRGSMLRLGFAYHGKKKGADEVKRTRAFLAGLMEGVPPELRDDNDADALAAAYTARLHAAGQTEAFGEADEGLIHLPRPKRAP